MIPAVNALQPGSAQRQQIRAQVPPNSPRSKLASATLAALLLFVVGWSDPFVRIFPPAIEGRDLNPMLQHPGLIFHPPLLLSLIHI